ncbi:methyltransferase [Flavobacterium xanthum]|uniref:Methyltransferase domain-containing protein n=1 Tax=Flavobacterium xanthum TaxID=69322 RepID=A0A1M6Z1V2_9FLAO|nr:class I SAM-dependent methyltransferase [Flavobacterium xanthum]SHL24491.1 Methyltransferase domain-containing protein [Flavobacterium xanthum]
MANLYNGKMAAIYDAMYQNFIDNDEEFNFYNNLIQDYHGKTVLEIGSGSGNLSKRFLAHNTTYIGLDYSESMIAIAQERNKKGIFLQVT